MKRAWLACALASSCSAPPALPDAGAPLHYPLLPNGGGPVLTAAPVVAVTFEADPNAAGHVAFTRWLVDGWLSPRAQEYGAAGLTAGEPLSLPMNLPGLLHDAELQALLEGRPRALYLVFLPPGVSAADRYEAGTCGSNPGTGYHEHLDSSGAVYVVVPACRPRFSAVLDLSGSMHLDAARLAVDAVTNPSPRNAPAYGLTDPASPWTSLGAEAGDFCWGRFVDTGGYTLQRVWSNAAVRDGREPCQPAGDGPAFGLSVSPGQRVPLHIAEEARFAVSAWGGPSRLDVTPWTGDFAIAANLEQSALAPGESTALTVSVPYEVPPGTYGSVLLRAIAGDEQVLWPVSLVVR